MFFLKTSRGCTARVLLQIILLYSLCGCKSSIILRRNKRESVKIGDLPQIIPPVALKKGEQRYHNPGWTHCIKYLTATFSWRTIKRVNNLHKVQATQFQCSWYISSEIPNSNIRLSFEKIDFGDKLGNACTQQFLELIDIKAGKSQGRICGKKRHADYVSAGQKVRIDIQGSEPLVSKLREDQSPFIINYKVVKDVPGFRRMTTKNSDLKSKVKNSVGSAIGRSPTDRTIIIYGAGNHPGGGNPSDSGGKVEDGDTGTSLTVWQIALIAFIAIAFVGCIVGVFIKRKCIDDKKEKEYLEQSEWDFENGQHNSPSLRDISVTMPLHRKNHSDNGVQKKKPIERNIPRSSSKPEQSMDYLNDKKDEKDFCNKKRSERKNAQRQTNGHENKTNLSNVQKTCNETTAIKPTAEKPVDDTPVGRAPRLKPKSKRISKSQKHNEKPRETDENKNTIDDRPAIRKHRRKVQTKPRSQPKGTLKTDLPRDVVKTKAKENDVEEVDTPPSRAVRKTRPNSKSRKKNAIKMTEGEISVSKQRKRREKRSAVTGSKKLKSESTRDPNKRKATKSKRNGHSRQNEETRKAESKVDPSYHSKNREKHRPSTTKVS